MNVLAIDDIGNIPYEMIRGILIKIESPRQLVCMTRHSCNGYLGQNTLTSSLVQRTLERNSPQVRGVDGEIWMELIKRDVPDWESKVDELRNPRDWYAVYKKLVKENEERIAADAEVLRKSLAGIKTEQAKHKSKLVENPRFLPRVPVDPKLRRGANLDRKRSMLQRQGLPVPTTPAAKKTKSIIEVARREAQKQRNAFLTTPTHLLSLQATKVTSVPKTLIGAYSRPAGGKQEPMKEDRLKRKADAISDDAAEEEPVSPKTKLQREKEEKARRREAALAQGRERRAREAAERLAARQW
ncbi:hypothetical protein FGG08_006653 [Glutinoglossum americanum]|uniref:Elongin-A n=1 Tax=Glutinoglossum americanum TaxID=1670608 RepID=A0A9P8L050_9PEZI|nr:hypothetical protein FGG08_006653 [Glutinoglossum americanum]